MKQLQQPISARTIRRNLSKLIANHKIMKLGDKRGTRYCIQQNDITLQSFEHFDPLRVKYRTLRHELIRDIIINQLIGQEMENRIEQQLQTVLPEHQDKCRADIWEDLAEIAPHRIAGLGISQHELRLWLLKR